ncbi:hypothetical protein CR513_38197, partial [Mucuna pruriens]
MFVILLAQLILLKAHFPYYPIKKIRHHNSQTQMKCGRPIDSKDKNPPVRKGTKRQDDHIEDIKSPKDSLDN